MLRSTELRRGERVEVSIGKAAPFDLVFSGGYLKDSAEQYAFSGMRAHVTIPNLLEIAIGRTDYANGFDFMPQ
jgi:hypothetical protein